MIRIQPPSLEKLSLGYKFESDREIVSLIFINYFLIFLFSAIVVILHTADEELLPVTYRYHSFILFSIISLLLIRVRQINLARVLLLTFTPIIILILPPLFGVIDNEFYFWFPYIPIALSLLPHFILQTVRHRTALIITLTVYFLLALLIDNYLILFSDGSESIIPIVQEHRFYYNLIPLIIYIFVNLALGLLFAKNFRYEMIMQKQQNDLLQAEKMASLGTLTAGIAHEINNPLNFISGSLHALNTLKSEWFKLEEGLTPEQEKLVPQINQIMESSFEGVRRATGIISSLRFVATTGQEKKKVHDLDQIFYSVLPEVASKLSDHITLTKKIQPGVKVLCSEEPLQQVFSNVLDNAIDAINSKEPGEKGRIHVSVAEEKTGQHPVARISFSNTGPVIPEEDIRQVFDPFFTSKKVGQGKGLGMTISYMIVDEHDGSIEVRNEDGEVVVDIILPLATSR